MSSDWLRMEFPRRDARRTSANTSMMSSQRSTSPETLGYSRRVRRSKRFTSEYRLDTLALRDDIAIRDPHRACRPQGAKSMNYQVHTRESAPPLARDTLEKTTKAWGFLPNLGAVLAESPAALELLWVAYGALSTKGTLTPAEQQLVAVAASRENRCAYCVAAHSTMALGAKLSQEAVRASREGTRILDHKLEALRLVTERLVRQRGWLNESE